MNVIQYLDSKGYKYTVKGTEALLDECPFCKAEKRFSVNIETGRYICNRQNNCGASGVLKLKKSEVKNNVDIEKIKSEFEPLSGKKKMLEYMRNRGISEATLKEARVLSRRGAFCFFYTNADGKANGVKYRTLDKKIWAEKDSKMTLLNWDKVLTRDKLYVVEGEIDMLSFLEIGIKNVVSVPNGVANTDWIDIHYEWLESFEEIILVFDNDDAGKKGLKKVYERLNETKANLKTIDLLFYKDPNEVLNDENGVEKLKNIIVNNEKDIELPNTFLLSNVEIENSIDAIDTGDDAFNSLTGGIRYGEIMLVTGNAGSGKSTFLNNIIANLLNQNLKIYTHQGEFRAGKFKSNLYKIMCRPEDIKTEYNQFKKKEYGVIEKEIENKIDDWLGDRIEIHGSQVPSKNELLKTMEQIYKRKGIRLFFIDNLMTIQLDNADKYEEQKQLFIELQAFAKKYSVFIGIVAHPKKNNANLNDVDQYVISGASEIMNLANYGIYFKRLNEEEVEELQELNIVASVGAVVLKDREYGDINHKAYWNYEHRTGRFLNTKNQVGSKNKKYNWEVNQKAKEFEIDMETFPF